MVRVESALKEICERDDLQLQMDMPLREIEGWDSMRAVTFQVELERIFSVDLSDETISGSSTLADVAEILKRRGADLNPPTVSH